MGATAAGLLGVPFAPMEAQELTAPARSSAPLNVSFGMIGIGMQWSVLMRESVAIPGVKCIAACDLYDERHVLAEEIAGDNLPVTRAYHDLLRRKDIDCVVVAVSDHWHKRIVIDAVRAGKDVYCEKPMSHSIAEGAEMVKAVHATDRIVQIGSQSVSSPLYAKARQMIGAGAIGEVSLVELTVGHNDPTGASVYPLPPGLSEQNLDWNTWLGDTPKIPFDPVKFARWRLWFTYGSGFSGNLLVHQLSGMQYALGLNAIPDRATSVVKIVRWKDGRDVPDMQLVLLEYGNLIVSGRLTLDTETPTSTRFMGSRGVIDVASQLTYTPQFGIDLKPSYYDFGFSHAMRDAYVRQWHAENDPRLEKLGPPDETQVFQCRSCNVTQLHPLNFFTAVQNRTPVVVDVVFGHNAAAACHMANQSYRMHAPVIRQNAISKLLNGIMTFKVKKGMPAGFTLAALCLAACCTAPLPAQGADPIHPLTDKTSLDWPVYGGQVTGNHYSALSQINRTNVEKLRLAWTFDTGEKGILQSSPIIVGKIFYAYTPTQKVIALDAGSGKQLWRFDSGIVGTAPARGLAYWTEGTECRIFAGIMNFLYALDPATGKPIPQFGDNGRVDLRKGLGGDYRLQDIALTTPGMIYRDLIIVGGREPETRPAPPGDIRAFDVHTGALRWTFHTIPHPGEFGYATWPRNAWKSAGAANNWAGMSLDAQRGIVYVPTGSAVFDFYGADRVGDDLFADTLLALDAATGKRIWHFQGVHHDLWDRDFPSPPVLLTVQHNGKRMDAVAQTTKQGYVYLLDRATGEPLFPITERKYPASTVPGEVASPTQPSLAEPKPFARQFLTAAMLTTRTPEAHAYALKQFKTFLSDGQFVPLSLDKQTVVFPGFDGGAEWGGPAVDPATDVIYINANEMAWTGALTTGPPAGSIGEGIYQNQCSVCHGSNRAGSPPTFPSLVGIENRLTSAQVADKIHQGGGRMPAFAGLDHQQLDALIKYLKSDGHEKQATRSDHAETASTSLSGPFRQDVTNPNSQYTFTGYRRFLDQDGYPAISTPWGTLNAIDLNTGKYLWKIPLGEYPTLAAKGLTNTGSENYGGPVVTAGGLLFIGATVYDNMFRAFDSKTGRLLWKTLLPAAAAATPATYMVQGKQYVVIAAGGSKEDTVPAEGRYTAFALP